MKIIYCIVLSFLLASVTRAQSVGCISPGGNIYTVTSGTYMSATLYLWNGATNDPTRISNARAVRCVRDIVPTSTCYIRFPRIPSNYLCPNIQTTSYCYDPGNEVFYSALPCPLDDYPFFLTFGFAGIGFIFIRRFKITF